MIDPEIIVEHNRKLDFRFKLAATIAGLVLLCGCGLATLEAYALFFSNH